MPESFLRNSEWLISAREASMVSGNAFLPDKFIAGQPLTAWGPKNINDQSFERTRIAVSATPGVNQGNYEGCAEVYSVYRRCTVEQDTVCLSTAGWFEKRDPFTQTDLLDDQEEQVRNMIFRIRTSLAIHYRERLADRLTTLFSDAKEEDFASAGIALGSLQNFYDFLQLYPDLKSPAISLTPENYIYASWRAAQGRLFSVHFLPDGDTRFVIFRPNDLHPERQVRLSGAVTADILMATVTPYAVKDWICE